MGPISRVRMPRSRKLMVRARPKMPTAYQARRGLGQDTSAVTAAAATVLWAISFKARPDSNQKFAAGVHRLLCALAEIHRGRYRAASLHGRTLRDEINPTLQMLQPIECNSRPA